MITYKTIVIASKAFADNHHIIKNFGNGELWQLSDHDQDSNFLYPLMYMVDVPSSPGPKSWVYAFRVYFVSRVEAPTNRDGNPIFFEYTDAKSQMIACAQDFISYWVQDNNYKMTIDQALGVTTFIDVQEDNVTGCYIDLRFVVPFTYDSCVIPMDGVPDPDSLNVEIYINDTLYFTLTPGSSLMLNVIDTNGDPVDAVIDNTNIIVPANEGGPTPVDVTINSTLVYNQATTNQTLQSLNSDNEAAGSLVSGIWRLPDTTIQFQDSNTTTTPAGQTMNVKILDQSNNETGTLNVVDPNHLEIIVDSHPTAGKFVPLSWTGANVTNYAFQVPATTPNTYNSIARTAGATSFDMNIFSSQTMKGDEDWVIEGDNIYIATAFQFWGFGLQSITGINFANIDFCFAVTTGGVIIWYQSGVSSGTVYTLTANNYWAWRLEYNGTTKDVKLYIDGNLAHTAATGYVNQTLVVKHCGRNGSHASSDHVALRKVASSNRIIVPFGDSITDNNAAANFPGRNYVEKCISFSNHKYFVNPVVAQQSHTTATLISNQLPLASVYYDASYTSNIAMVMIGINDLRTSVPLATIQTNIQTIVSSLQTTGYYVIIHTVLRDFNTNWADRSALNTWILAGTSGADLVIDHTQSIMETDEDYFEPDKLHPNANGMTQIAFETYAHLNSAP